MKTKIKFRFFGVLYKTFAFLADKTNGWKMFVKPKLLLGALIVGISAAASLTSCEKKHDPIPLSENDSPILCYFVGPPNDTTKNGQSILIDEDFNLPN
jgi:hypothetical protein